MDVAQDEWAENAALDAPVLPFHWLTTPLASTAATVRPSGEKATAATLRAASVRTSVPSALSRSSTPLSVAVASSLPSGETTSARNWPAPRCSADGSPNSRCTCFAGTSQIRTEPSELELTRRLPSRLKVSPHTNPPVASSVATGFQLFVSQIRILVISPVASSAPSVETAAAVAKACCGENGG